jgi:hypothetical protein
MRQDRRWFVCAGGLAAMAVSLPSASWASERVHLARQGQAVMQVVTAEGASERTRAAASTLAEYLSRIAGAEFERTDSAGQTGLVVGLVRDFPELTGLPAVVRSREAVPQLTERENYLLRSHRRGLWVLGATELAVEDAVWDLLYRLGYRQFFPGARWEIVPAVADLAIDVDVAESPDYLSRRIWYGYGAWDYAQAPYQDWCAKNRVVSGIELHSGHAYGGFIRALRAEFGQHPEFYPLVNGQRQVKPEAKLCIGNADLRRRVAEHAVAQFRKTPAQDSISVDPSDGGGWCECEACARLGSVTDRALLLANEVAAAVNAEFPGKLVGMYAYNYHSPPPSIRPHPQVVISVATAFLKGGLTLEEILQGWSDHGTVLGIREYYSVNVWDRDLPGHARGANLDYLRRTIPAFHARGARYLSAESSDNWGPNGLGYYLAARMLWDVEEAGRLNALVDDFLARAFGTAQEPMAEFYRQLDGSRPRLVQDDQLGRMFRALDEAYRRTDAPAIRARLDDLTLYARYVDLYFRYAKAKEAARQAGFEQLIRHAYRMRTTMLVHTKALYRDLAARDKTVSIPADCGWNVPEGRNPWKSSTPFAADELAAFRREGIDRHPLARLDFTPVAFSKDLVSAQRLRLPPVAQLGELGAGRQQQVFLTRVDQAPTTLTLRITGGLIAHYRDRGNVRVDLIQLGGASATGQIETPVVQDRSVPPDGTEHTVQLTAKEPGLYKIIVNDGGDRTQVAWDPGLPLTVESSAQSPMNEHHGMWAMYFYVPRGTKTIGLFGGEHGEVLDAAGRPLFWLNGRERNYYSVSVPDGQDGQLWRFRYARGPVRLLTVPPYLARSGDELLLPREVVERDGGAP